ncbi:uncharacterized protein [Watersipora subatra]|uniref:uncharacterized protein n=1 Tax=Watersipora subatra TaxID=2589382 RepID=UPI00355C576B
MKYLWGSTVCLIVLLAALTIHRGEACECKLQKYQTYNYWIDSVGTTSRDIHIQGSTFDLLPYSQQNHLDYAFLTKFYECGNGRGTFISTEINKNSLGNFRSGFLSSAPVQKPCYNHPALFKFSESFNEASGKLKSGSSQYLDSSDRNLIFNRVGKFWQVLPSLSKRFSSPNDIDPHRTTVTAQKDGRDMQVDGRGQLGARRLMPGEQAFEFIVEVFGFCKRLNSQGRVIQGTAVLLSSTQGRNTMSEREFLQVRVTDEGQVALPAQNDTQSPSFGMSFSRVELRVDDKRESRERYSRLLLPNTANEETIDERYFEVLRQRDGTYRLATVINPNLFVALIRVRNGYELGVLPYNSNFSRDLVSYDFNIDIPEVRVRPCYQPHAPNHVWPPYHNHHNHYNHYNHHNHHRRFHDRSSY